MRQVEGGTHRAVGKQFFQNYVTPVFNTALNSVVPFRAEEGKAPGQAVAEKRLQRGGAGC